MSHVCHVETEFKDPGALRTALDEVFGKANVEADVKMSAYYAREDRGVDFCVRRPALIGAAGGALADMGFAKDGDTYRIVMDQDDSARYGPVIDRVKQRYAVALAKNAAKVSGYSAVEETVSDGSVRLVMTRW